VPPQQNVTRVPPARKVWGTVAHAAVPAAASSQSEVTSSWRWRHRHHWHDLQVTWRSHLVSETEPRSSLGLTGLGFVTRRWEMNRISKRCVSNSKTLRGRAVSNRLTASAETFKLRKSLRHTELQFYLLFYMGVDLSFLPLVNSIYWGCLIAWYWEECVNQRQTSVTGRWKNNTQIHSNNVTLY
jgi:hypothetical protein